MWGLTSTLPKKFVHSIQLPLHRAVWRFTTHQPGPGIHHSEILAGCPLWQEGKKKGGAQRSQRTSFVTEATPIATPHPAFLVGKDPLAELWCTHQKEQTEAISKEEEIQHRRATMVNSQPKNPAELQAREHREIRVAGFLPYTGLLIRVLVFQGQFNKSRVFLPGPKWIRVGGGTKSC